MIFQHFFLIVGISIATASFFSERYNIFDNAKFGTVRRIFFTTQIPNTIESTECLNECNKIRNCLNVLFQKNQGSSVCELGFIPHSFNGTIQYFPNSTIYQKNIPDSFIGSVALKSNAFVIYWKRKSSHFIVKYSIDNGNSWNRTNDNFRVLDTFNRNSTYYTFNDTNLEECESFCLNQTNCFHFTFYNQTCEIKDFQPNFSGINHCPNETKCYSLVASNQTFVNTYEFPANYQSAYIKKIAFFSDDDSIWSEWNRA